MPSEAVRFCEHSQTAQPALPLHSPVEQEWQLYPCFRSHIIDDYIA